MTDTYEPTLVDARGLACPQPVLRLRAALRALPAGGCVRLLASDPLAEVDVAAYCVRAGHDLLDTVGPAEDRRFLVRKGAPRERQAG